MKFGLFALFQALPKESAREKLDELLAQVMAASGTVSNSILVGQHYLLPHTDAAAHALSARYRPSQKA